jgi:peroxisomal 3,2-trans-enoyl-CoA isomerase
MASLAAADKEDKTYSVIDVSVNQDTGVAVIRFNRAKRLNSFVAAQYKEVGRALNALATNDACRVCVLTGAGAFYSSGHDLAEQSKGLMRVQQSGGDLKAFLERMTQQQAHFLISAFIDFPKPLVAAVNGPAVGVAVTTLALADIVYASSTATFHVPFMQLGFCAEGCSSLLFPQIMGVSKANEMLLMGRKLTASDAERVGFVAQVFPQASFMQSVMSRVNRMAAFPGAALVDTKTLTRANNKAQLHATNDAELKMLVKRFMSPDCVQAVMQFMMQAAAKKKMRKKQTKKQQQSKL